MKHYFLLMALLQGLSTCLLFGQLNSLNGPVTVALSGCEVGSYNNAWGNPAMHAFRSDAIVAIGYEARYNISQLSAKSIKAIYPSSYGGMALGLSRFGYQQFNTTHYTGSYSRLFGTNVAASFQLNWRSDYQNGLGHSSALFSNVGLVYSPSKQILLGIHAFNPEQAEIKYGSTAFKLPAFYKMGVKWQLLSHTAVMAESTHWIDNETQLATAMESTYKERLFLRLGYQLLHKSVSWGLGVKVDAWHVDCGFSWQMPIGMASSIGLAYQFSKIGRK